MVLFAREAHVVVCEVECPGADELPLRLRLRRQRGSRT